MARLPRLVIPGHPLHIIQRGNNRQAVFYAEEDYHTYLDSLGKAWGYIESMGSDSIDFG